MKCNRCGKCCFYFFNGKLKKCRYLLILSEKLTFCKLYPRGFGKEIDNGVYCNRETVYNYPDCPFNDSMKPDFSVECFFQNKHPL